MMRRSDNLDQCMQTLQCAFNRAAAKRVMCRNALWVDESGFYRRAISAAP